MSDTGGWRDLGRDLRRRTLKPLQHATFVSYFIGSVVFIGGLGIWFWVAYVAGVAPLLVVASIGDWWWWAALVLLPPLAAAVSWPFGRPRITNWHRWVLVGAAALTVGYAVWWYAFAN